MILSAQAGLDVDVSPRIFLNLDVKYIDMSTDARLTTTAIGTQRVHVDINPVLGEADLGFRF